MPFEHTSWKPRPYSMGVPIGFDWEDKPEDDPTFFRAGFWTRAETQLLHEVVKQFQGHWIELGVNTGHCSSVIADHLGPYRLTSVDPMFSHPEWYERFAENVHPWLGDGVIMPWAGRSDEYFNIWDGGGGRTFTGALIDGDHDAPCPLQDAKHTFDRLNERGVILLHDFRGPSVYGAAEYLVDRGMQFKVYPSVHMVCVCWRGEFTPPPVFQEGDVDWAKHYGLPEWAQQ